MKIAGTNIDRHAATALALMTLIWLGFAGFDLHLLMQWLSGAPEHANAWEGVLFVTGGLIILPVYMSLIIWPKSRLVNWLNGRTTVGN